MVPVMEGGRTEAGGSPAPVGSLVLCAPAAPIVYVVGGFGPSAPSETLRVLIVSEDPRAGAEVAALLADEPECLVVGRTAPGRDLPRSIDRLQPDVMVWAAGPDGSLSDRRPDLGGAAPPVLVLAPADPSAAVGSTVGAQGLLPRDVDAPSLAAALRAVGRGLIVLDPVFARGPRALPGGTSAVLLEELTPRELEVLRLLAEGLPNKLIARHLGISEHTTKFHIAAIFGKLDAHTRTEAVARAAGLGLVAL
ncbi:MAG TPA: response regulator transcription factor [bacterium]|nr:response regulator transcription factor [bacterium]